MNRQARVGMILGLAVIIAFGLALSEFNTVAAPEQAADAPFVDAPYYRQPSARTHAFTLGPEPEPIRPAERHEELAQRPAPAELPSATIRRADDEIVRPRLAADLPAYEPVSDEAIRTPSPAAVHTVRPGETLYAIAQKYYGDGQQYKAILQANRQALASAGRLQVGQRLRIPGASPRPAPARAVRTQQAAEPARVRELDVDQLRRYVQNTTDAPQRRYRVYVVQPGDSLTAIASKFYDDGSPDTIQKIFQANQDQLDDPNHLVRGMKLKIPG